MYRIFDHRVISYTPGWYRLYNRLMCWSDDIQGDDPNGGPWKDASPDTHITETVR